MAVNTPLRIGIAGLGTVGVGVVKTLQQNAGLIQKRTGRVLQIVAVSARSRDKDRGIDLSSYEWFDNAPDMADPGKLDIVVELIGGTEGSARDLVEKALGQGISVVTANKALVAHHGYELAKLAEDNGAFLLYEAAVAGGIPAIKLMREGYASNNVDAVFGILNGTSNYILSVMRETGRSFEDVLKEAQDKGYAEADPAFDIEGTDAAHKLALLAALAFGVKPDMDHLPVQGITQITAEDTAYAEELGYRLKLLGMASREDDGITQSVEPCLVPAHSALAAVEGVFNAVFFEGDFLDSGMAVGRGAGEGPTATAVCADLIDLARGNAFPAFGMTTENLKDPQWKDQEDVSNRFYIRMLVLDKPGVLADVGAIMRDYNISIEVLLQRGRDPDKPVPIVITTHTARKGDMMAAIDKITALDMVVERPTLIRIETFD